MIEKTPELFSGFLGALFLFSSEIGSPIEEIILENMKITAKRIGNMILVFVVDKNTNMPDLHHRIFVAGEIFRAKYEAPLISTFTGNIEPFKPFREDLISAGIILGGDQYVSHCPYCGMGHSCPYAIAHSEKAIEQEIETRKEIVENVKFARAPFHRLLKTSVEPLRVRKASVDSLIDFVLDYSGEVICPRLRHLALEKNGGKDRVLPKHIAIIAEHMNINIPKNHKQTFPITAVKRLLDYGRVLYSQNTPREFEKLLVGLVTKIGKEAKYFALADNRKTVLPIDIDCVRDRLFIDHRSPNLDADEF